MNARSVDEPDEPVLELPAHPRMVACVPEAERRRSVRVEPMPPRLRPVRHHDRRRGARSTGEDDREPATHWHRVELHLSAVDKRAADDGALEVRVLSRKTTFKRRQFELRSLPPRPRRAPAALLPEPAPKPPRLHPQVAEAPSTILPVSVAPPPAPVPRLSDRCSRASGPGAYAARRPRARRRGRRAARRRRLAARRPSGAASGSRTRRAVAAPPRSARRSAPALSWPRPRAAARRILPALTEPIFGSAKRTSRTLAVRTHSGGWERICVSSIFPAARSFFSCALADRISLASRNARRRCSRDLPGALAFALPADTWAILGAASGARINRAGWRGPRDL